MENCLILFSVKTISFSLKVRPQYVTQVCILQHVQEACRNYSKPKTVSVVKFSYRCVERIIIYWLCYSLLFMPVIAWYYKTFSANGRGVCHGTTGLSIPFPCAAATKSWPEVQYVKQKISLQTTPLYWHAPVYHAPVYHAPGVSKRVNHTLVFCEARPEAEEINERTEKCVLSEVDSEVEENRPFLRI